MTIYYLLAAVSSFAYSSGFCLCQSFFVCLALLVGMAAPNSTCRTIAHWVLPTAIYEVVQEHGILSGAIADGRGGQAGLLFLDTNMCMPRVHPASFMPGWALQQELSASFPLLPSCYRCAAPHQLAPSYHADLQAVPHLCWCDANSP